MDQVLRLLAGGEFGQAEAVCRRMLKHAPADARVLALLIRAQASQGDYSGARASIEQALKTRPGDVDLLADRARAWLNEGRFPEAIRAADRALRLVPGSSSLVGLKAHIQAISGDHSGAWETMRAAVESGAVDPGLANSLALIARRVGQSSRAISMVRACLADAGLTPERRAELCFRLGDLLDSEGDWDPAFAAYEEGNRIRRALYRYDVQATAAAIDELISVWPPGVGLPSANVRTDRPVFIIGMPRSGTSLVEQILGSHPAVFPAGELEDIPNLIHAWQGVPRGDVPVFRRLAELSTARLDGAAKAYLERLRRLDGRATRVTDKMPVNFLHLGLISLMFPAARAVHCERDPMDTCLSCYFQNFSGMIPFAYDLRELGLMFGAYQRLMLHWAKVLQYPMHSVPYERTVQDQEATSRQLLEFAGVPWDDRVLRFHETKRIVLTSSNDQVRRPVYASSVGRWRHYERHLGPLARALGR